MTFYFIFAFWLKMIKNNFCFFVKYTGKFVSLPMSVGNVLEGIKLTYSETPKDSVNAAVS